MSNSLSSQPTYLSDSCFSTGVGAKKRAAIKLKSRIVPKVLFMGSLKHSASHGCVNITRINAGMVDSSTRHPKAILEIKCRFRLLLFPLYIHVSVCFVPG